MGVFARILLLIGGVVTGWFVARDADNFHVINFMVTLGLFVLFVAGVAFRSTLAGWWKNLWKRIRPS